MVEETQVHVLRYNTAWRNYVIACFETLEQAQKYQDKHVLGYCTTIEPHIPVYRNGEF